MRCDAGQHIEKCSSGTPLSGLELNRDDHGDDCPQSIIGTRFSARRTPGQLSRLAGPPKRIE